MNTVAIYLPDVFFWGDLTAAPQIGGREFNAVMIAEALARRGWLPTIYCPMAAPHDVNGVFYRDPNDAALLPFTDVLVALNGYDILKQVKGPKKVVWIPTGLPDLRTYRTALSAVVVSSPAKGDALRLVNPWLPANVVVPIFSGTDPDAYAAPVLRKQNRLLWCSSRERGLHHVLRWWPKLREARPDLVLHVTYDPRSLGAYRWEHTLRAEITREVEDGLQQPGVVDLGAVTRERLVREQQECTLWVCPVEFQGGTETGSFSIPEFCAAGTPMLLGEDISFTETGRDVAHFLPYPVDDAQWISAILHLLRHPLERDRYAERQREVAQRYTWAHAAAAWDSLLSPLVGRIAPTERERTLVGVG